MPTGPEWICDVIQVQTGFNADGTPRTKEVQLWRRNLVDCVRQIIGDPTFDGNIAYGPDANISATVAKKPRGKP